MKRWICALVALLVCTALPVRAQAPVLGPNEAIGWDYADLDVSTYQVNRFEAAYDGGAFATVGMVVSVQSAGITTYKTTPTPQNGTHTVAIRACNVAGCGPASSPFGFVVLSAPPSAPVNLHIVPR